VEFILIAVVVVIVLFWIGAYNSLVKYRNWVEESWAQIDVQLKRRYDLIPNLVETVKGYAKYEQETLEKVISARNAMVSGGTRKEQMEANDALSGTLKTIFALSESYPDLKANNSFVQLQEELVATENKIAYSRQLYNNTVMKYNIKIQTIPSNFVASLHGFKKEAMLEAKEEERENVKVSF
jgi:LemA protein